jgi:hypothetical protein
MFQSRLCLEQTQNRAPNISELQLLNVRDRERTSPESLPAPKQLVLFIPKVTYLSKEPIFVRLYEVPRALPESAFPSRPGLDFDRHGSNYGVNHFHSELVGRS